MRISAEQIALFDAQGYLHLRNYLPPPLVEAMRSACERATERALADPIPDQICLLETAAGRFVGRINPLHRWAAPASLALAGSRELRAIGEAFCGPAFLAVYESLALKVPGDEQYYGWHQDLVYARRDRVVTVGVYLNPTSAEEGALRLVPGSHRARREAGSLPRDFDVAEAVVVPARAGDVVVHDAMIVHGSDVTRRQPQRMICYFEYRPLTHLRDDPRFTSEWIEARLRLAALERSVAAGAHPVDAEAIVEAAHAWREPHEPAHYV